MKKETKNNSKTGIIVLSIILGISVLLNLALIGNNTSDDLIDSTVIEEKNAEINTLKQELNSLKNTNLELSNQKCLELDCEDCPAKIETKEIINYKYVCSDGLVMDSEDECKNNLQKSTSSLDNSKIETIINSESRSNTITLIRNDNILTVEYKTGYNTESILIQSLYEVTRNIAEYQKSINLEKNLKVSVVSSRGELTKTSSLSWNDINKMLNYEMSYDDWLKTVR